MASLFRREHAGPDEMRQPRAEPGSSPAPPPSVDAAPADAFAPPQPPPPAAAPSEHPTHNGAGPELGPQQNAVATPPSVPPPPLDTTEHASRPPNGATPPPETAGRHHPQWRGPVGIAAALAAAVVLVTGGMAVGRATSPSSNAAAVVAPTAVMSPSTHDLQQTVINVIHVVQPSVVEVKSSGQQGGAIGSGEILTPNGYIVTNDHVVAGFSTYTVTLATGQAVPAQLVGVAPQDDLAVLRVHLTHLVPIAIGNSSTVQVGQFAIAMGSPLGLQQSATLGIVSALDREASEAQNGPLLVGLIQTSAPINPGNSGGALVDLQGHLIGIPTLAAENPENGTAAGGIGFAIPSDRVRFVADQLMEYGHLVNTGQGFLGIQGLDVTPELAAAFNLPVQSGVLIAGFANDAKGASPAAQAGLRQGDIVVAVNGTAVAGQADLTAALLARAPGTQVSITVQRGARQQSAQVTLGERPAKQSR